jgi:hypothetical protein
MFDSSSTGRDAFKDSPIRRAIAHLALNDKKDEVIRHRRSLGLEGRKQLNLFRKSSSTKAFLNRAISLLDRK